MPAAESIKVIFGFNFFDNFPALFLTLATTSPDANSPSFNSLEIRLTLYFFPV